MDSHFKSFFQYQAIRWARSQYGVADAIATMDDESNAEVYGENVLAWEVLVNSDEMESALTLKVAIDPDGYVSVNLLANPKTSQGCEPFSER